MHLPLRQKERSIGLLHRKRCCVLIVLGFSFFNPVQLWSQTLVKLMAAQAAQLKINLEEQQYFGDAIQFTLGSDSLVSGGTSPYSYEWMHNSALISTEPSIVVTPVQNDVYSLKIIDSLKCSAEKDIRLKIETGTDDRRGSHMSIYPNPARDYIHIAVSDGPLRLNIILYNSMGKAIWKGEISNNSILPLHYSPGFYLLQIKNGNWILEKKLIIH